MAHTKALGSTKLGRDSIAKRLGIKINDGQKVYVGQIILRQRGTKYLQGTNVLKGGDDTFFAKKNGVVRYSQKTKIKFDGHPRKATMVSVI